jgi:hypothetical protein
MTPVVTSDGTFNKEEEKMPEKQKKRDGETEVLIELLEKMLRKKHPGLIEVLLTCSAGRRERFVRDTIPKEPSSEWVRGRKALRVVLEIEPQ